MSDKSLAGKVAIVTGASAGIGRATALALACERAAVVIHARRKERLDDLAAEIHALGGRTLVVAGNAADESDVAALMERACEFSSSLGEAGRLDIVVANAGRGLAGGLLTSDSGQWREMYDVNVMGAAHLMRRAGARMVEQGRGDIVVLGSVAGYNVSPFSGFYGSAKFAIAGMTEAFRREICAKGVRVTLIKPGIVRSEFQQVAGYTTDNFYKVVERYGRLLEPSDVADAIVFVVTRPPNVHINDLVIRPVAQDYP